MPKVSDRDIWASASLLLKQHKDEAAAIAARRAEQMLELGDKEGASVWGRIEQACVTLSAKPTALN